MTAGPDPDVPEDVASAPEALNVVRLRGRLAATPLERELPSGDVIATFRLVVDRVPVRTSGAGAGVRVDTLDCAVFLAGVRRRVVRWCPGDVVDVQGSLRRRFFRTAAGAASRYEVEVRSADRVARATDVARATMSG
jgi:single-strand DNA-binding protein